MAKVLIEETNLENIANSIRAKNGMQETYLPSEMATAISNIPSGGGIDWSEIGYSGIPQSIIDGINYAKQIYDNWDNTITILNGQYTAWQGDANLVFFPLVDTSNVTYINNAFSSTPLLEFPSINTSNVTTFAWAFFGCEALKKVNPIDLSKVTMFNYVFYNCANLEHLPVFDLRSATNISSFVQNCSKLTDESLNNILASLISATSYTGTKTLGAVGLTSTQISKCQTLSNWDAFVAAGWSA